ncbi:DsbC family protein [Aliikangiella sp. G2MR2-5]|uniref:DsbC family protein n=1 Tax=Aliikangiella sp. G2MR2-5 TaxID=2788943 RepID=UPI0018ABA458|nr:DsbC family protein [Aliikangiella sp. G2MR2-5]
MSLNRKIGVLSALVASGFILYQGISNRQAMNQQVPLNEAQTPEVAEWQLESIPGALTADEVKSQLEKNLQGIEISDIEKSPLKGYYQAFLGGEVLYVSVDGRFLMTGMMLEIDEGAPINHTQLALARQDLKRAPMRAKLISGIDESDMVVFKASDEKHVVTVFTDVDCAYCRKLHKEMPMLNENGITVRYMAYPRAGIGSSAYRKLVSVWCADDKQEAMNIAKLQRQFSDKTCKNPVAAHYNLVRSLNLSGTPAVITETGEVIGGYLSADDMLSLLNKLKSEKLSMNSQN